MLNDTPGHRKVPMIETPAAMMEALLVQAIAEPAVPAVVRKRGRPTQMSNRLLAAGVLWCLLHGWVSQMGSVATHQLLWRRHVGGGARL